MQEREHRNFSSTYWHPYECCVMDVPEVALLGIQLHVGQYSLSSIKHTVFERSSYVPTIIILPSRCTFRNLETAINIVEFPFFITPLPGWMEVVRKMQLIHQ